MHSLGIGAVDTRLGYDAAGNVDRAPGTRYRYTYDAVGRLGLVKDMNKAAINYAYDYQHRRTRRSPTGSKYGPAGVYHYDGSGHLIAETTPAGAPLRSYVWRDDVVVAQIEHQPTRTVLYLETDYLGAVRAARSGTGQVVWRGESDAFGATLPSEDPDGNHKATTVNLRFPGQIADTPTPAVYNWHRYYDPSSGRYVSSDPIGLAGGLNTYAYALSNPIRYFDSDGLEVRFVCRKLSGLAQYSGKQHCFVYVTCPKEGWSKTFSLFGASGIWPSEGYKAQDDARDNPNSPNNAFNQPIDLKQCFGDECAYEKAIAKRYQSFPGGNVPYSPLGPNSNSFAQDLATGTPFGGHLPQGAPGPDVAPGIDMPHPNFP